MTIRPVDFATIQRTDDVGMLKHQQDAKPAVEQQNIQVEIKKQEFDKSSQVRHADDTENNSGKFDAREEGKNKYSKNESKKKKGIKSDGKIVQKTSHGGFDMKV